MVNKHTIKRLIRVLVPDTLIALFRLHQQSRHVTTNVDVFLEERSEARSWLAVAPDTYRVRLGLPEGEAPSDVVEIADPLLPIDDRLVERARAVMVDPEIDAVVVGETPRPRMIGRYRSEPTVGPRLILARKRVLDEIGWSAPGEHPLPDLLSRIRSTGSRIGLIPVPLAKAPTSLTSRIERDAIVIFAVVPLHDVGGGPRSTQLAIEFAQQGFDVTLVPLFQAQESVDLGLRFVHPNLREMKLDSFDPAALNDRVLRPGLALVEAPSAQLNEPAFVLQDLGWELVYDLIDDWSDPALGGSWFRGLDEQELVARADRIIASAPDLVERIRILRRPATLVPNAVNSEIFGVDRQPRPQDMPEAVTVIGYHGSLYGDWFDWNQLQEVAEAFPDAAVVVIGDDVRHRPAMPTNVHFLGLKPQIALPAYLQHFDVGLIPFKVSQTTHAVSPLKVFEYLASGVPVAAPPLRALAGLDSVFADYDLVPMVRAALAAGRPDRQTVLSAHSWAQRALTLFPESRRQPATVPTGPVRVITRPVVHWARTDRLVR